jgi:hypothetical protein
MIALSAIMSCGLDLAILPAHSAPMPSGIIGTWAQAPGCPTDEARMILAARQMTVIEKDGKTSVIGIDTIGRAAERLEVHFTKVPQDTNDDPEAPGVGDMFVFRLEKNHLRFLGLQKSGVMHPPSRAVVFTRCT